MSELLSNPLWWVIPVILVGSFLVNHKVNIPHLGKKEDNSQPNDGGTKGTSQQGTNKPSGGQQ